MVETCFTFAVTRHGNVLCNLRKPTDTYGRLWTPKPPVELTALNVYSSTADNNFRWDTTAAAGVRLRQSLELAPERFRILPEVHYRTDDNALRLDLVKNSVWEVTNQHPAISACIGRSNVRMLPQQS
jgi:hypothetical protein